MLTDPTRFVQALVQAELIKKPVRGVPREKSVVTVSRSEGAGGEEIASDLAERLGVHCFNQEIIDRVAADAHVDRFLMERLDEHVKNIMNDWVFNILTGKDAYRGDYKKHLVNVLLGIQNIGGVIVGRGAHIVLKEHHCFRVRIVGSLNVRAARVGLRDSVAFEEAKKKVETVDKERDDFIETLYDHDPAREDSDFDLILNTDLISYSQAVDIIISSMEIAGLIHPTNHGE